MKITAIHGVKKDIIILFFLKKLFTYDTMNIVIILMKAPKSEKLCNKFKIANSRLTKENLKISTFNICKNEITKS